MELQASELVSHLKPGQNAKILTKHGSYEEDNYTSAKSACGALEIPEANPYILIDRNIKEDPSPE